MSKPYLLPHYVLTTAEILYHMPDYPSVLQTYIWQDLDQPPNFPLLKHFLDFWENNLEGKLYKVRVSTLEEYYSREIHHFAHGYKLI